MNCPRCGAVNAEDSVICRSCGTSLVSDDSKSAATRIGLKENVAGMLCYLLGWITGLLFIKLEKGNDFVRFHAVQSIFIFGGLTWGAIVFFAISLLLFEVPNIGVIVWLFWVFAWLWVFLAGILWIFLMVKAYRGKRYKLRWVGNIAEKYI